MVLQCSKFLYNKASSTFLRQDSQSSYSFGKIHKIGETELSEEDYFWVTVSSIVPRNDQWSKKVNEVNKVLLTLLKDVNVQSQCN